MSVFNALLAERALTAFLHEHAAKKIKRLKSRRWVLILRFASNAEINVHLRGERERKREKRKRELTAAT